MAGMLWKVGDKNLEQKSVAGMEKEERKSGGIYIKEGEKDTYIYLCGIKPTRNIHVNDFVEILPTTASPLPDDMIDSIMKNGSGSEFELGMLIATLRSTSALLKIKNSNARELANKPLKILYFQAFFLFLSEKEKRNEKSFERRKTTSESQNEK